jgi:hypothetical protein
MITVSHPALAALRRPETLGALGNREWTALLQDALQMGLLYRLAVVIEDAGVERELPVKVRERLAAVRPVAQESERSLRWEVDRVSAALRDVDTPIVLLKGAAYAIAGLPAARGRVSGDLDILVAKDRLDEVERALLESGWEPMKLEPYDQRYYRDWSHELPPLKHRRRKSVLDVHHTILPVTGRLRPDVGRILTTVVPVGTDGLGVLCPEDMVLHSAAHLFQDGDLAGGLRDLTDLDLLLKHYGGLEPKFWTRLVPRAVDLGLTRPLFYALRCCGRFLGTAVPPEVVAAADRGRPVVPPPAAMDWLVARAFLPARTGREMLLAGAARGSLYVRFHWLRLPPWLLARHLVHKVIRYWFGTGESD